MDSRYEKLAANVVSHSTHLQSGEKALIHAFDVPHDMTLALVRAIRDRGAVPYVQLQHARIDKEWTLGGSEDQFETALSWEMDRMKAMDAYIALRGSDNVFETSDLPQDDLKRAIRILKPVLDWRVKKTKWCVLRWPTSSMAQQARMSTEAFEDFYFDVCTFDYRKLQKAMNPLARRMSKARNVHLIGPGTDLQFSIKGMSAIPCGGDRNIPDGEVFSCPEKKSCNGVIQFNTPSLYAGTKFENVRLELKEGKVVNATANNTKRLNEILDTDAGARYIGEFSLGLNPFIESPMCDILFDEKITGSLHFTPGQAYEECDNGNRSAVHWDMVLIQRKDWGGGEVWFDGELIRKNGLFVAKDLLALNPKNLKK